MSNKMHIFEQVSQMEAQIGELYEKLGSLKNDISQLIEENHRLTIENEHLRKHFYSKREEERGKQDAEKKVPPHDGLDNLKRLYAEGFHICQMHFGSPRSDEDCLFCFELINID